MGDNSVRLNQPVAGSAPPRTYFFNGRLLSAEDLKREQTLRENGQSQLARLIGCGVAAGLGVTGAPPTSVLIEAGLGVTPSGMVIDIEAMQLDLSGASRSDRPAGFSACAAAMANLEAPAAGLYVLVLTPTWIGSGRAATLLGEVGACNRAVEQPAVRARLHKVNAPLAVTEATARNVVAHALLAPENPSAILTHRKPVGAPVGAERLTGWWPANIVPTLGADDLPLALLRIDHQAKLLWLDGPAVRRRIAPPPGLAGDDFWRESHAVEMEAFGRQFIAQAADEKWNPAAFVKLPPVALMDDATQLKQLPGLFEKKAAISPLIVGRADFVKALHEGLHDATVAIEDARPSVLQLRGSKPERYLLRMRHKDDQEGAQAVFKTSPDEHSSARLATIAGTTLRDKNADAEKRSLAASVLTQAPDKNRRRARAKNPASRPSK